jgi:hypothetical protein
VIFTPLAGTRVVDLTSSLAGPYCTSILAALGADVVKVERVDGGDETRAWGPPFWDGDGVLFLAANAAKRSLALDLRDERGRAIVLQLADRAQVFVVSLRPGLAAELGLDAEALRARNPALWLVVGGAAAVLVAVVVVPGLRDLFRFGVVHPDDLATIAGASLLALVWLDAVRLVRGRLGWPALTTRPAPAVMAHSDPDR